MRKVNDVAAGVKCGGCAELLFPSVGGRVMVRDFLLDRLPDNRVRVVHRPTGHVFHECGKPDAEAFGSVEGLLELTSLV